MRGRRRIDVDIRHRGAAKCGEREDQENEREERERSNVRDAVVLARDRMAKVRG